MKKILGLVLAGVMVFGLASPAEAQAKYRAYTRVYTFEGNGYPGIDVWVYRRNARAIPISLRYIKVCLQRGVTWLLYSGYRYRIYVPPTAYHYSHYSTSFVA